MGDSQIFGLRPEHGKLPVPTNHEREEYHDFLEKFIDSDFFEGLPYDTKQAVVVARDTLCWTLGHENGAFETNLAVWSDFFKDQNGYIDAFNN